MEESGKIGWVNSLCSWEHLDDELFSTDVTSLTEKEVQTWESSSIERKLTLKFQGCLNFLSQFLKNMIQAQALLMLSLTVSICPFTWKPVPLCLTLLNGKPAGYLMQLHQSVFARCFSSAILMTIYFCCDLFLDLEASPMVYILLCLGLSLLGTLADCFMWTCPAGYFEHPILSLSLSPSCCILNNLTHLKLKIELL